MITISLLKSINIYVMAGFAHCISIALSYQASYWKLLRIILWSQRVKTILSILHVWLAATWCITSIIFHISFQDDIFLSILSLFHASSSTNHQLVYLDSGGSRATAALNVSTFRGLYRLADSRLYIFHQYSFFRPRGNSTLPSAHFSSTPRFTAVDLYWAQDKESESYDRYLHRCRRRQGLSRSLSFRVLWMSMSASKAITDCRHYWSALHDISGPLHRRGISSIRLREFNFASATGCGLIISPRLLLYHEPAALNTTISTAS
jgi:hypothetical protein